MEKIIIVEVNIISSPISISGAPSGYSRYIETIFEIIIPSG